MKYIRTKDGVYEVKCVGENHVYVRTNDQIFDNPFYKIKKEDIIQQSDTIDELCDLYYMVEKKYPQSNYMLKWVDIPLDDRHEYDIYAMIKTTDIHGAPIIKSVAKLNEKGELELL